MITIKPITQIPTVLIEDLNEYSRAQWEAAGNDALTTLQKSCKVWLLHENDVFLGLAGAIRTGLVGTEPVLWMLTSNQFRPKHAKQMRFINETIRELLGEPMIAVAHDEKRGKFLEFIGFARIAQHGEHTLVYRMN